MSCDGGNDEAAGGGGKNGSSAAEAVGGGACWCGDDYAVAAVGGHIAVVNKKAGIEQGVVFSPVDEDFIEGIGAKGGVEEGAFFEGKVAFEQIEGEPTKVVSAGSGEESEVTEVDAEDWG